MKSKEKKNDEPEPLWAKIIRIGITAWLTTLLVIVIAIIFIWLIISVGGFVYG